MHDWDDAYWKKLALAVSLLALLLVACGGGDDAGSTGEPATTATEAMDDEHMDDEMDDHAEEFAFGEPADAADADRVIEIEASDDFAFDPPAVTVQVGETVTFRVTNVGAIPHDFTLGDQAMQDTHDAEMAEMGGEMEMHDEPNVFSLEPGETKEMTWHFTAAADLQYGCHQVGHYAAGMKGALTVEA